MKIEARAKKCCPIYPRDVMIGQVFSLADYDRDRLYLRIAPINNGSEIAVINLVTNRYDIFEAQSQREVVVHHSARVVVD